LCTKRTYFLGKPAEGIPAGRARPGSSAPASVGVRERESSPDESHAARSVLPSGRLMACVLAAQGGSGVRAARHNQRPRAAPPALRDAGRAVRTVANSLRVAASQHDDRRPSSISGGTHRRVRLRHGLCRLLGLETPALQGSSCPHRHNQPLSMTPDICRHRHNQSYGTCFCVHDPDGYRCRIRLPSRFVCRDSNVISMSLDPPTNISSVDPGSSVCPCAGSKLLLR